MLASMCFVRCVVALLSTLSVNAQDEIVSYRVCEHIDYVVLEVIVFALARECSILYTLLVAHLLLFYVPSYTLVSLSERRTVIM